MSKTEEGLEVLPEFSQEIQNSVINESDSKECEQNKEDSIFQEMKNLVSDMDEASPNTDNNTNNTNSGSNNTTGSNDALQKEQKNENNPEEGTTDIYQSNPQINMEDLKSAQEEMNEVDVVVCGGCHSVYHFPEDLIRHKSQCKRVSNFRNNVIEMKPQVWAFLLWKNAQGKINRRGIAVEESSWKLYQKWCKMPERIRSVWVAAGEAVMNYTTFGTQPKQPDPPTPPLPPPKAVVKKVEKEVPHIDEPDKPVIMRKLVQRDHTGEIKEIRSTDERPVQKANTLKDDIENLRNQLEGTDTTETKLPTEQTQNGGTLREEEFVVEKIVSRRFNPKKKQYEYLLKWEGYPAEQNTWEPAENLETCQHLLKSFEESLAKQSYSKQKVKKLDLGLATNFSQGRPVRFSKQKALSQVKQWCGSIKPDELETDSMKRKFGSIDSDEEEFLTKRARNELESDNEEVSAPAGKILYTKAGGTSGIVKRVGRVGRPPKALANGGEPQTTNLAAVLGLESSGDESDKTSPITLLNQRALASKVLVANAKGVLKVDPNQMPNLTSGVYVMSNKSIVKLDSVTTPAKPAIPIKQNIIKEAIGTSGQVVMIRNGGVGGQKSGIMRKNPGILKQPTPTARPQGSIRMNNQIQRLQSGIVPRSSMTGAAAVRPRGAVSKPTLITRVGDIEKRIVPAKAGRGGLKSGIHRKSMISKVEELENKLKDLSKTGETDIFEDYQSESSESDVGVPDDFPKDLPPPQPDSPPRPLTLCPLTGKVLAKAEGEKTPEPTPPQSPVPTQPAHKTEIAIKEEEGGYLNTLDTQPKALFVNTSSAVTSRELVEDTEVNKTSPKDMPNETIIPENEEDIVTITGEDGLVYKVSNSDLGTLLGTEEGEQCVYVTEGDDEAVLALASQYHQPISQVLNGEGESEYLVKEEDVALEDGHQVDEEPQGQVVAQLVEAGEPAPGGLRRVVLLLPDGNLMMTEVDEEQYAALELDK